MSRALFFGFNLGSQFVNARIGGDGVGVIFSAQAAMDQGDGHHVVDVMISVTAREELKFSTIRAPGSWNAEHAREVVKFAFLVDDWQDIHQPVRCDATNIG